MSLFKISRVFDGFLRPRRDQTEPLLEHWAWLQSNYITNDSPEWLMHNHDNCTGVPLILYMMERGWQDRRDKRSQVRRGGVRDFETFKVNSKVRRWKSVLYVYDFIFLPQRIICIPQWLSFDICNFILFFFFLSGYIACSCFWKPSYFFSQ